MTPRGRGGMKKSVTVILNLVLGGGPARGMISLGFAVWGAV